MKNRDNVTVIAGDVTKVLPDSATLFYLLNPFDCNVMASFRDAFITKFYDKKLGWVNEFWVAYYNPVCLDIFFNDKRFESSDIVFPQEFHSCVLIEQAAS